MKRKIPRTMVCRHRMHPGSNCIVCDERNFDTDPYTVDENRVADYLHALIPDIGSGDDPIGFLLASHSVLRYDLALVHDVAAKDLTLEQTWTLADSIRHTDFCTTRAIEDPQGRTAEHMAWMLERIADFDSVAKASRWLGYVQAWQVIHFQHSLDALKRSVRDAKTETKRKLRMTGPHYAGPGRDGPDYAGDDPKYGTSHGPLA